ncbi:hypothetical protein E6C60_3988 [Paenibacillus algicola]|uniref:Uncharacterized protein n=1 Tax=Paenibacillus algicola TaxID=2565926 RepID=A0A4P8XQ91_9BACL|nr:hypothetical protein E6C60_3988 [Paenibacillus algicola]
MKYALHSHIIRPEFQRLQKPVLPNQKHAGSLFMMVLSVRG